MRITKSQAMLLPALLLTACATAPARPAADAFASFNITFES